MGITQFASNLKTRLIEEPRLPEEAKKQLKMDRAGLPQIDHGAAAVAAAGINWLIRSQDQSIFKDGGSARDYSLIKGWASSYPETSGYIVPTLIEYADRTNDKALLNRAQRMLDWLVAIQFPEGGFQGGKIDATARTCYFQYRTNSAGSCGRCSTLW